MSLDGNDHSTSTDVFDVLRMMGRDGGIRATTQTQPVSIMSTSTSQSGRVASPTLTVENRLAKICNINSKMSHK